MESKKVKCWIARDLDGSLYLFEKKPSCIDGIYYGFAVMQLLPYFCSDIRYSDGPRRVLLDISISYIKK